MDQNEEHALPPAGPVFTVRRPLLGAVQLYADGVQLRRRGMFGGANYLLPMPDGTTKEVALRGLYSGARVVVDGVEQRLESPLPTLLWVIAAIPLALVVLGGAIGGGFGAVGFIVNLRVAGSSRAVAVRVLTMLLVAVLAIGGWLGTVYFVLGGSVTPVVGDCYDGIRANAPLVGSQVKKVSCSGPHDAELFGEFTYPSSGSYPSEAAFQAFAEQQCVPAFEAYVGVPITESIHGAIPTYPNASQWADGNRVVRCVVVSPTGGKLTGSAKDSKQ